MTRFRLALLVGAVALSGGLVAEERAKPTPAARLAVPALTETPAVQREWRADAGEVVRAHVTSPRPNGKGSAFSDWYGVESPAPPSGMVLKSATFHLVGDRFCAGTDASPKGAGTAAECRQDMRTDGAARWAFRMQGHDATDEVVPWNLGFSISHGQLVTSGPAGTSRGVLICTYAPAPTPTPAAAAKK